MSCACNPCDFNYKQHIGVLLLRGLLCGIGRLAIRARSEMCLIFTVSEDMAKTEGMAAEAVEETSAVLVNCLTFGSRRGSNAYCVDDVCACCPALSGSIFRKCGSTVAGDQFHLHICHQTEANGSLCM